MKYSNCNYNYNYKNNFWSSFMLLRQQRNYKELMNYIEQVRTEYKALSCMRHINESIEMKVK